MKRTSSAQLHLPSAQRGWVRAEAIDPLQSWAWLIIISTSFVAFVASWTVFGVALLGAVAAVAARRIFWRRRVAAELGRFEAWIGRAQASAGDWIELTVLLPSALGVAAVTAILEERERDQERAAGGSTERHGVQEVREWKEIPGETGDRRGATVVFELPENAHRTWVGQRFSRRWAIAVDLTTAAGHAFRFEAPLNVRKP
jgi:hypothetical protein